MSDVSLQFISSTRRRIWLSVIALSLANTGKWSLRLLTNTFLTIRLLAVVSDVSRVFRISKRSKFSLVTSAYTRGQTMFSYFFPMVKKIVAMGPWLNYQDYHDPSRLPTVGHPGSAGGNQQGISRGKSKCLKIPSRSSSDDQASS